MAKKTHFYQQKFLTAVELMIVLSLLGILAALLIGGNSLALKRAEARILRCRGQLQQFSQALFLYSGDHCSILPPRHDMQGLNLLRDLHYLPPSSDRQQYLYYGGLLQVEFQQDIGMIRDRNQAHATGGNTAFGDGHVTFFPQKNKLPWQQTDCFFQMDHRNPETKLRKLNRKMSWSDTWTAQP